jgi:hypothetical protein
MNTYFIVLYVLQSQQRLLKTPDGKLEYGGTFTKIFMNVSSQHMFPTTRNLQIRVHV